MPGTIEIKVMAACPESGAGIAYIGWLKEPVAEFSLKTGAI